MAACKIDIQLTRAPVEYLAMDFPPSGGAEAAFLGRTRAETHTEHGELVQLDYDAYERLAIASLQSIAQQAATRYACLVIRVHHAIGPVRIGEASVLIQVACGHRAEAFDAARYLIDELKRTTPIWKREIWQHGTSWSEGTPVAASGATP